MGAITLLLYPIALAILIGCGAHISRGKTADAFFTLEQTKMIQGICCICVILHHLTQYVTNYSGQGVGPVGIFNDIGFLFTGVFFFISGYGLVVSLERKPDYLKNFLLNRLSAVLIPFWLINAILVIGSILFFGHHKSGQTIAVEVLGLQLINSNGWFIIEIVLFYVMFFLLSTCFKKRELALSILSIFVLIVMRYSFYAGHDVSGNQSHYFRGEWWYNSTFLFILGLWYGRFYAHVNRFLEKTYRILLPICFVLAFVGMHVSAFAVRRFGYYNEHMAFGYRDAFITLVIQTVSGVVFTTLIVLLNMRLTIGNRALRYIGKISLPLFLCHGCFVRQVFEGVSMPPTIRYGVVLTVSILCASILEPACRFLVQQAKSIGNIRKPDGNTLEGKKWQEHQERIKKYRKIEAGILATVVILAVGYTTIAKPLLLKYECNREMEALQQAKEGDIVSFGRYNTSNRRPGKERLEWIVIHVEGNQVCLLSKQGIAGSEYHMHHEPVTWDNSSLRERLNSAEFTSIFSTFEKDRMATRDGDLITLLTPGEAEVVFATKEQRELAITDAAKDAGTNINEMSKVNYWDMKGYRTSWWWLRGENTEPDIYGPLVTMDGEIETDTKVVNKPSGAIRPVIWVEVESE